MARNNIYPTKSHEVYKRYAKVPTNIVAGLRADPFDSRVQVGWTLSTSEEDFNYETKTRAKFNYENEVIEIYSEQEDALFRRLNKNLLSKGLLKEYTGVDADAGDTANFLTDAQVNAVVEIRSLADFTQELSKFTSEDTLQRILDAATASNKSFKKIQAVEARIKAVKDVDN
jgi:hypothetical protein